MNFGFDRQGAGDADALALAAAELMGIAVVVIVAQTDLVQQFHHPVALGFALGELVDLQALADDVADPHARVERGVGILKDDLHLAPGLAQLALGQATASSCREN